MSDFPIDNHCDESDHDPADFFDTRQMGRPDWPAAPAGDCAEFWAARSSMLKAWTKLVENPRIGAGDLTLEADATTNALRCLQVFYRG